MEHTEDFDELDAADMADEFTTEDVKALADNGQEEQRVSIRRRARGADVDDPRTAKRGHTTPAQAARGAQKSKRENPVAWRPGNALEAPPAPPGMVLRWVRDRMGNSDDPKNMSKKLREGWVPYLLKDAPEDYIPPEVTKSSVGEIIRVGDLVLCMMPVEMYRARKKFYLDKANRQKKAVAEKFRTAEDPQNRVFEREYSEQSSGGPRVPRVQPDA